MSFAAFLRPPPAGGFVPVADLPLELGSDPACALCDLAPGVAPRHAALARVRGTWVLSAGDGLRIEAGGGPTPFLDLREGDEVRLAPGAAPWRFRTAPDEASAPASAGPATAICTLHGLRCVRKRLAPPRGRAEEAAWLRLLAALGGAPQPSLAPVVDGGVRCADGLPARWVATAWVPGRDARRAVADGGLEAPAALHAVAGLAVALAHLHARGVQHRDVAPGNVVLTPGGGAVLIDYGHARLAGDAHTPSAGVVGTPGYVAPEEVLAGAEPAGPAADVYGLAAVAYALLSGAPPSRGEDVLDALARAGRPPVPPRALGIALPAPVEEALLRGLDPDPGRRPSAASLARTLAPAVPVGGPRGPA